MTLKEMLDDLNGMILRGEILESMDKYYDPDCVVVEKNDIVAKGLQQAKERESEIFAGVEAWLKSQNVRTYVLLSTPLRERFCWPSKAYMNASRDKPRSSS